MIGGYGRYVRNLSRGPGYGLRGRRKDYAKYENIPAGPKLIRGRGRPRRRLPDVGPGTSISTVLLLALLAALGIWALRHLP